MSVCQRGPLSERGDNYGIQQQQQQQQEEEEQLVRQIGSIDVMPTYLAWQATTMSVAMESSGVA